jgi:hypothetical protein
MKDAELLLPDLAVTESYEERNPEESKLILKSGLFLSSVRVAV